MSTFTAYLSRSLIHPKGEEHILSYLLRNEPRSKSCLNPVKTSNWRLTQETVS